MHANVEFQAPKTLANAVAWPNGKPVWGGTVGAGVAGETKSVTFSNTGAYTVTAECGNTRDDTTPVTARVTLVVNTGTGTGTGGTGGGIRPTPFVMGGDSNVTLRLVRPGQEETMGQGLSDTVGGSVVVQMIIEVGAKGRVRGDVESVMVRLKEDAEDVDHPFEQNHADVSFGFTQSDWVVWKSSDTSPTPTRLPDKGSAKTANTSADTTYFYVKGFEWNTAREVPGTSANPAGTGARVASTLLGHNARHEISLVEVNGQLASDFPFEKQAPTGTAWEAAPYSPTAITCDVKNLVITEAKAGDDNPDFVRCDIDSTDENLSWPSINFKFSDGGFQAGDEYHWTASFLETNLTNTYTRTGVLTSVPTDSVPATLLLAPSGVYGFTLDIAKKRNGVVVDRETWRSPNARFTETSLSSDGNDVLKFGYRIEGNITQVRPLSEVNIAALNGDWSLGQNTSGPTTMNPRPALLHTITAPALTNEEPGEGRVVATGVDDEATRYRAHVRKRLWPMNQVGPLIYRMLSGDGPQVSTMSSGAIDEKGTYTFTTPQGKKARLVSRSLDMNRTPANIWSELSQQRAARSSGGVWHPVLVTTHGHSSKGSHVVSMLKGGGYNGGCNQQAPCSATICNNSNHGNGRWVTGAPVGIDYDITLSTTPNLRGVTFFNLMGCKNSVTSAGAHIAKSGGMSDIAQIVSTERHALNSMGYAALTYFRGTLGMYLNKPGQAWFDSLYDPESLSYTRADLSGDWAEADYLSKLDVMLIRNDCTDAGSTPNWGWDSWVVTNTKPIIDR